MAEERSSKAPKVTTLQQNIFFKTSGGFVRFDHKPRKQRL